MIYRLNCSSGNTIGVEEYISYSEIDDTGAWRRYLEIRADDTVHRYNTVYVSARFGELPDGVWIEAEAVKPEYGVNCAISKELFESAWRSVHIIDERAKRDV